MPFHRSIITRRGDDGSTDLIGGARISKASLRIQAMGDLDELNSMVGMARAFLPVGTIAAILDSVQRDLLLMGSMLAQPDPPDGSHASLAKEITRVENEIHALEVALPPLRSFLLPGGTPAAATLHVARSVCRRAERSAVALEAEATVPREILIYLNRLSDLLFLAARGVNHAHSGADKSLE